MRTISKRTQYGLKAVIALGRRYGEGPVLIATLSAEETIPLKFLEGILLDLKGRGVLDSKKGKGGGYYLAQPPKKTTLATVIRIVGGPIALLPCVSLNFYEKCKDCNEAVCGLNKVMLQTRDATLKILGKKTLAELIDT